MFSASTTDKFSKRPNDLSIPTRPGVCKDLTKPRGGCMKGDVPSPFTKGDAKGEEFSALGGFRR